MTGQTKTDAASTAIDGDRTRFRKTLVRFFRRKQKRRTMKILFTQTYVPNGTLERYAHKDRIMMWDERTCTLTVKWEDDRPDDATTKDSA